MRRMIDGVNVDAFRDEVKPDDLVAGYVDGKYRTFPTLHQHFPHNRLVSITVTGRVSANVGDVENGDMTPLHGAQWAKREHDAGRHPTLYCSESEWHDVRAAVEHVGLHPERDVSYWIADETDGKEDKVPDGAVARQYALDVDQSYDVSNVHDYWPGVDPHSERNVVRPQRSRDLPVLREGEHNGYVRRAQALLIAHGAHHLDVDGIFGPETEDAVIAYQDRIGIDTDGVIGAHTWHALLHGDQ